MFEIRKSAGGWSIDRLIHGSWMFYIKFSSKRKCLDFIKNKAARQNPQQTLF